MLTAEEIIDAESHQKAVREEAPEQASSGPQGELEQFVMLPIGTRIEFLRTLTSNADEDGPGNHYATKGDGGEVTGHGCREGHWVKCDHWAAPFGAELGKDFKAT